MSTGITVCSVCKREAHQDGPREWGTVTWRHCEDKTRLCAGAAVAYAPSESAIVGRWCGEDRTRGLLR